MSQPLRNVRPQVAHDFRLRRSVTRRALSRRLVRFTGAEDAGRPSHHKLLTSPSNAFISVAPQETIRSGRVKSYNDVACQHEGKL